jgi:hypothetical protein
VGVPEVLMAGVPPTSQVLASLSEELQRPLASLRVTLELLVEEPRVADGHEALAARLESGLEWLEDLVGRLTAWTPPPEETA